MPDPMDTNRGYQPWIPPQQSGFPRFTCGAAQQAGKLRFPTLFAITAVLFTVSMLLPDPIPFLDEILFGLGTLLLASWKKRKQPIDPVIDGRR